MPERPATADRQPSLTRRIATLLALWTAFATILVASVVIAIYTASVNRDFGAVLSAHLGTLVAGVRIEDGVLVAPSGLAVGEARFEQPGSGWYWSVEPVGAAGAGPLAIDTGSVRVASSSLGSAVVPPPPTPLAFEGLDYRRSYRARGPSGSDLLGVESEIELEDGRAFRFRVFGNQDETDRRVRDFALTLVSALALFGIGTVLAGVVVVRIGLRPLERVRVSLQDVREGRAERITEAAPREVAPLVDEVNALIEGNRRIVERARVQVGNLAHGLKTPLSIIVNAADRVPEAPAALLREQTTRMRMQVDAYLDRARIAAGARAGLASTPVAPVIERVLGAMRRLRPDHRFEWEGTDAVFAGERHDLEEVAGNLVENAGKWARHTVWVHVAEDAYRFTLTVEDDGPGLPEGASEAALGRGVRLDESVEGTGLGLSIVADIVAEYEGAILLERSDAGGLRAVVTMPARQAGNA